MLPCRGGGVGGPLDSHDTSQGACTKRPGARLRQWLIGAGSLRRGGEIPKGGDKQGFLKGQNDENEMTI